MANHLNEFDRLIKESYEKHQDAYDPTQWDALRKELGVVSPGFSSIIKGVLGGVAITTVVLAAMMFFVSEPDGRKEALAEVSVAADSTHDGDGERAAKSDDKVILAAGSDSAEKATDIATDMDAAEHSAADEIKSETAHAEKKGVRTGKPQAKTTPTRKPDLEPVRGSVNPATKDEALGIRTGCTGMTIQFSAPRDYADDAKFLWNFGDGYFSNESDPSHTFSKEGIFDVSLSVTSHSTGQISSNVIQAMIKVSEAPSAYYSVAITGADEIKVDNESYGANYVDWNLDGETLEDISEISIQLTDNTRHEMSLVAHNQTGCSDTLTKTLFVSRADNRFPKAYSPSYSSGFAPGAITDGGEVTDFRVFDSVSGKEVFHASGAKGWLGSDNHGNALDAGKYDWVMVVDRKDSIQVYRGEVELRK